MGRATSKYKHLDGKMAHWVEVLASKSDGMNLKSSTHKWKERTNFLKLFSDHHACVLASAASARANTLACMHTRPCRYTVKSFKENRKLKLGLERQFSS